MDTNKITRDFCAVLRDHGYDMYDQYYVEEIVNKSLDRKAHLIKLFRKHPNWDEDQLCIHFDRDFDRKTDMNAIDDFLNWLWNQTRSQIEKTERDNPDVWGNRYWYDESKNPLKKIIYEYTGEESYWGGGMSLYESIDKLPRETILPEFANTQDEFGGKCWYQKALEAINKQNTKFNFRPGMKFNRVINKICQFYGLDKLEGYDAQFARFSDGITPLKINRHTTISVNPIDFLLMSNGNSWSSCHYIGDDPEDSGCYSSGTISYMMGEDSFIVSIIDKEWPDSNLAMAPKINRQVFGYNDHQLLQSRLYPQNCDRGANEIYRNLREMVEQIIADAEGEVNRWVKADKMNYRHDGNAYSDWTCFSTCDQYNLRNFTEMTLEPIRMDKAPVCISCGLLHYNEGNILCEDCYDSRVREVYCEDCGRRIYLDEESRGEDYYTDDDGLYWCSECRFECARCGEIHRRRYEVYITDIDETWCDECAGWYAKRCDHCGEWFSKDNIYYTEDGEAFCENCLEEVCEHCKKCGGYYRKENMTKLDDEWYCEYCAEEIVDSEEEVSA